MNTRKKNCLMWKGNGREQEFNEKPERANNEEKTSIASGQYKSAWKTYNTLAQV